VVERAVSGAIAAMADLSAADAIERARIALGIGSTARAVAIPTRRLDRTGGDYFLIVFSLSGGDADAVATVETDSGEVGLTATLPGTSPFPPVSAQAALDRVAAGAGAAIEAVWSPCRASFSPLYILWQITLAGRVIYVDQQAGIHDSLPTGGRGGGGGAPPDGTRSA